MAAILHFTRAIVASVRLTRLPRANVAEIDLRALEAVGCIGAGRKRGELMTREGQSWGPLSSRAGPEGS